MPESEDEVLDKDQLHRFVTHKNHWVADASRPSTALFKNPKFSSFVERLQSAADAVALLNRNFGSQCGIVRYSAENARKLEYELRLENEDDNPSHVNVYQNGNNGDRKRRAMKLRECCEIIRTPSF